MDKEWTGDLIKGAALVQAMTAEQRREALMRINPERRGAGLPLQSESEGRTAEQSGLTR